jgi:hypothetical protein
MVEAALATIPTAELPAALHSLARAHGVEAVPVLARCLGGRPEWVAAAAAALGSLPTPSAANVLQAAESRVSTKLARTAIRRGLYRLRQAGVTPVAPGPSPTLPPATRPSQAGRPTQAWMSAIDGTGTRGVWLLLEGPLGAHTLLRGAVSDTVGLLDGGAGAMAKRRVDREVAAFAARGGLVWVAVPPPWAWAALATAVDRPTEEPARPGPRALASALATLGPPPTDLVAPIVARLAGAALSDPSLLDAAATLLDVPECAGWFLDPALLHAEALELLQTRESRLVVSEQIKAERRSAVVDRVIDAHFDRPAARRWAARLREQAFVLHETGRPDEARYAAATAQALDERSPRSLPLVRVLVERSLEVAGEVALGRVSAESVSRVPRTR